jgi:hypothetical protein
MLAVGGALLTLSFALLLVVLVITLAHRKEHGRFQAVLDTPTVPIAQWRGAGFVEVQGRALAGDEGMVTSPVTGRQVISYDIAIERYVRSRHGGSYRLLRSYSERRGFWVDDGSLKHAYVDLRGAVLLSATVSYAQESGDVVGALPQIVHRWTPQLEAWARREANDAVGRLKIATREIDSGSRIYVLGEARDNGGVMCLRAQPGTELVVSTLDESQLVAVLGKRARVRRGILIAALSLVAVSVGLVVLGIVL